MTDYLEIAKRNIVHPNFHNGNTLSSEKIRFLHIWVEHIMRQDDPKRFQFYANEAMTRFAIDQKIVDYVELLWQLKIDTSTTVNKIMS